MSPTTGPCASIVSQAIALGILCRPVTFWRGEALEPLDGLFNHVIPGTDLNVPYIVKPQDLLCDWELTTLDLLTAEAERDFSWDQKW